VDLTNGQLTPNNNTPLLTQALSGTSLKSFFSRLQTVMRFPGLLHRAAIDSRGNAQTISATMALSVTRDRQRRRSKSPMEIEKLLSGKRRRRDRVCAEYREETQRSNEAFVINRFNKERRLTMG